MAHIETYKNTTYILECARKGSTLLVASAMSALGREPDYSIPLAKVPLHIRRHARAFLAEAQDCAMNDITPALREVRRRAIEECITAVAELDLADGDKNDVRGH